MGTLGGSSLMRYIIYSLARIFPCKCGDKLLSFSCPVTNHFLSLRPL